MPLDVKPRASQPASQRASARSDQRRASEACPHNYVRPRAPTPHTIATTRIAQLTLSHGLTSPSLRVSERGRLGCGTLADAQKP